MQLIILDSPYPIGESVISYSKVILPDAEDSNIIIITSSS